MVKFKMLDIKNVLILFCVFITACMYPMYKEDVKQDKDIAVSRDIEDSVLEADVSLKKEESSPEVKKEKDKIQEKQLLKKDIITEEIKLNKEFTDLKIKEKYFSDELIKIGLLIPLSGSAKAIGASIYNASEMALFESKAKNIMLLPRDTGDSIESAVNAAQALEKEGVSILIGPLFSSHSKAIREKINLDIPIFSFTNDESIIRTGIWSFGFSPQQQIQAIIKEIKENSINNIAIIIPNTAYGQVAMQTIKLEQAKTNIHIKKVFKYIPESNDLSYLNESSGLSKNIDYEGILILASGRQLREIASRVQFIGVDPKKIKFFGLSGWNSTSIFGEPSLYGGSFVATDHTAYEAFVSRYHKIYGNWPSEVSALGYDIVALCSFLLNKAEKQSEITSLAMNADGFKGLFGFFKLGVNGKIYRKYISYKVMERSFLKKREIMPEID